MANCKTCGDRLPLFGARNHKCKVSSEWPCASQQVPLADPWTPYGFVSTSHSDTGFGNGWAGAGGDSGGAGATGGWESSSSCDSSYSSDSGSSDSSSCGGGD